MRQLPGLRIVHYYIWQFCCLATFKREFDAQDFDFVHHVTFVNDWTPSAGAFFGPPFVLGPIGRHPPVPMAYLCALRHKRHALKEFLRSATRTVASFVDPLRALTHRRARTIFIIHPSLARRASADREVVLPAVSIDLASMACLGPRTHVHAPGIVRIFWTGNFLYWKGPQLAIDSFILARAVHPNLELHMFGDGSEFAAFKTTYGATPGLHFRGRLPQAELFAEETKMDVFLYPSFEGGGMVVLEAMAMRKPVVGLHYGGLSQMVTPDCGLLVDFTTYGETAGRLADQLVTLAVDPQLCESMGLAGHERVKVHFSIASKCNVIERAGYGIT